MDRPLSEHHALWEILEQLENDEGECWHALEGLASLELETRLSIIDELSRHHSRPGSSALLRILSTLRDPLTRASARAALAWRESDVQRIQRQDIHARITPGIDGAVSNAPSGVQRCLVAPVDGNGLSTIVISVHWMAQRRTAAFLCDLERGILDVFGDVEP